MKSSFCAEASRFGQGVSAQRNTESVYWNEHGEDVNAQQQNRHRRSAAARRQQRERAHARVIQQILRGFKALDHRGCEPTKLGEALVDVLKLDGSRRQPQQAPASFGGAYRRPASSGGAFNRQHMPVCRHHAAGRCTYGSMCRFSHGEDDHNNNEGDGDNDVVYNEDGPNQYDNNEQQHNDDNASTHDDNIQHDDHDQLGDDVTEIITILSVLDDEDRQHATAQLSPNLYVDVMNRLTTMQRQHDATHVYKDHSLGIHSPYDNHDEVQLDAQLVSQRREVQQHDVKQYDNVSQHDDDSRHDVQQQEGAIDDSQHDYHSHELTHCIQTQDHPRNATDNDHDEHIARTNSALRRFTIQAHLFLRDQIDNDAQSKVNNDEVTLNIHDDAQQGCDAPRGQHVDDHNRTHEVFDASDYDEDDIPEPLVAKVLQLLGVLNKNKKLARKVCSAYVLKNVLCKPKRRAMYDDAYPRVQYQSDVRRPGDASERSTTIGCLSANQALVNLRCQDAELQHAHDPRTKFLELVRETLSILPDDQREAAIAALPTDIQNAIRYPDVDDYDGDRE